MEQLNSSREFIELWSDDGGEYEALLEVSCEISSPISFLNMSLVSDVTQGDESLYYHPQPLALIRSRWQGEILHLTIRVPHSNGATRRVLYFWNEDKVNVKVMKGIVKVHHWLPDPI